ncbi:hypothetical protein MKX03_028595 [Papaver bracteatum]|nr:hypothetical protein MKX03_028595 [Papaver bracteatum]
MRTFHLLSHTKNKPNLMSSKSLLSSISYTKSNPFSDFLIPSHFHHQKPFKSFLNSPPRTFATMGEDSVKGSVFPNGLAVLTLDRPKALNAMNLVLSMLENGISLFADVAFPYIVAKGPGGGSVEIQLFYLSSDDSHNDVKGLLAEYNTKPESDSQLELPLPHFVSSFGSCKSVIGIIEELKKLQQCTDATGSPTNLKPQTIILPFSLCISSPYGDPLHSEI